MSAIIDPKTGNAYTFKKVGLGFVPLSRFSNACLNDSHKSCISDFGSLITTFESKTLKSVACLCQCHTEEEI